LVLEPFLAEDDTDVRQVLGFIVRKRTPKTCQSSPNGGCARSIGKHSTGEPPSHQVLENVTFEQRQLHAAKKSKFSAHFLGTCGAGDILMVFKWTTAELRPGCRSAQAVSGGQQYYSL